MKPIIFTPEPIPARSEVPHPLFRPRIYAIALIVSLLLLVFLPVLSFLGYITVWILWMLIPFLEISTVLLIPVGFFLLSRGPGTFILCFLLSGCSYVLYSWLAPFQEYCVQNCFWFMEGTLAFFYENSVGFYAWIPLLLVLACGGLAWLLLLTAKFLDFLPQILYGRVRCPHSNCGYTGKIGVKCPFCGTMIPNLAPTRYGVFATACPHCELRLATGWLWGKSAYSKYCSHCFKDWNVRGLGTSLTRGVILAGAPKSGKTSFMVKSVTEMRRFYPNQIEYTTERQESNLQSTACRLSLTNRCKPTRMFERPAGVPILFRSRPRKTLVYFYDSAGEEFQTETTFHLFYENADGIFLFLDPFAEPEILRFLQITPNDFPPGFEAAKETADVIAGKLCGILERVTGKDSTSVFHLPLCVVLTKTEMFDLYKKIDSESFSPRRWEAHSRGVRDFLRICGLNNFLGILDSRFTRTMFFTSSAYMNFPRNPHDQNATLPPALWLIKQVGGF